MQLHRLPEFLVLAPVVFTRLINERKGLLARRYLPRDTSRAHDDCMHVESDRGERVDSIESHVKRH